jgi:single-strand DNA-binding protein
MSGFAINTVTISGNLTRDPELRQLASGTSVCGMRIAHNDRYKNRDTGEWTDRANYFDITVWSGLGEAIAKQCRKGDRIVVQGRLNWREWDADDGSKRQAVQIVADSVITPGKGERNGGDDGGRYSEDFAPPPRAGDAGDDFAPPPAQRQAQPVPAADDDEIPF